MQTGTVINWSDPKGFGFIRPEGAEEDLFVHFTAILCEGYKSLTAGQRVRFEVETGPKGKLQAAQVQVIKGGN